MNSIATVEELSAAIPLRDIGKADPGELQRTIDAAVALCERYTGRKFSPDPPLDSDGEDTGTPVARHFPARGRTRIRIPDLRSATSVTLDGVSLTRDIGFYLDTFDGYTARRIVMLSGFTTVGSFSSGDLKITGRWGMLQCPEEIKDSIIEHAARRWRQRDARWSDQVVAGEGSFTYFRGIGQTVKEVWDLYREPNLAVI